jgi:hypothetical protein
VIISIRRSDHMGYDTEQLIIIHCILMLIQDNINWQTLQQIIEETADKIIGKIERTERN